MLRLVHPAPKGQEKRARKPRRSGAFNANPEEQKRIHAAIRNIARAYGGRDVLAEVMGVSARTLSYRRTRSYSFAYLLARAAGVPIEQILSPGLTDVRACSVCGRKGAR